jgi:hypothetical protein
MVIGVDVGVGIGATVGFGSNGTQLCTVRP